MIPSGIGRVFEKVFGVPLERLALETSPKTVENWDSMSHIELILALENEFGVRFATQEFPLMTSVAAIISVLKAKGKLDGV